jgi:Ca2+-binding RTX toxin-like protein
MLATVVALYNSGRELGLVPAPFMDGGLLMRRTLLVMATMSFAVLVIGGVAYALTFTCTTNPCVGTADSDNITGTNSLDFIDALDGNDRVHALAGSDQIHGGGGRDRLFGDQDNDVVDGFGENDVIYGGPDNDGGAEGAPFSDLNLEGAEGSDTVYGNDGADIIDAAANDTPGSHDRSLGGAGNDRINAFDGNKDLINCGDGGGDLVRMDERGDIVDTQRNCETLVAP